DESISRLGRRYPRIRDRSMSPQLPLSLPAGLLGGVVTGALFVLVARRAGRYATWVFAVGLIVAALIYLGFALGGAISPRQYRWEIRGVIIFTPVALAGARWWPSLVGLGWLAHAGWDMLLHWPAQPWVPSLYPVLCGAFDLVVAAYFLFLFTAG